MVFTRYLFPQKGSIVDVRLGSKCATGNTYTAVIRSFLQIWSHLLKKSLLENFIFCAVLWKSIKKRLF